MYPTLFKIGSYSISTYGVVVALAVLVAAKVAGRSFEQRGLQKEDAFDLIVYAIFGGLLGAKLYFVLLTGDLSMLLSRGGLVWYGGLMGGTAAALWRLFRKRLPLGTTVDALAPSLALGHGLGHIACFFSGDSYGLPSNLPWAVAFPRGAPPSTAGALRNHFGVSIPSNIPDDALLTVHPTMLYSTIALLVAFAILWRLRNRPTPPGWLFAVYLILAGTERFLVEFLRAKDDRFLYGLTIAQGIAALSILVGLIMLGRFRRRAALHPDRA